MIIVISLLFALELSVNISKKNSNNFDYELSVYISKKNSNSFDYNKNVLNISMI